MFCFGVAAAWQSPVLTTGQSRGDGGHSSCQSTKAATEVTSVLGERDKLTPSSSGVGSDDCGKYRMCWFVCVFSLRPSAHRGAVGTFRWQSIPPTFCRCAGGGCHLAQPGSQDCFQINGKTMSAAIGPAAVFGKTVPVPLRGWNCLSQR